MDNNVKKNQKLVQEESEKLYKEIISNGYEEELAKTISEEMKTKGGYLFNASHSFSYAVLCLQTAYLKVHYPIYFYKALLNLKKKDNGVLNKYINDAIENNIEILAPDINKSDLNFVVYNGKILFGLSSITGLGEKSLMQVIEERNNNGKFKGVDDLLSRTQISESQLITLVKAGAIPCKDKKRFLLQYANKYVLENKEYVKVSSLPTLKKLNEEWNIDTNIIKDKKERLQLYNERKKELFIQQQNIKNTKKLNDFIEKYLQDEDMWEFNTLSIFLTNNPFTEVYEYLKSYEEVDNGEQAVIVGVISNVIKKKDKRKRQYAYINLYTAFGIVEITCWASQYAKYQEIIKKGNKLSVLCNKKDDKFMIHEIKTFDQWKKDVQGKLKIKGDE